jgi:uncharacterized repeat protein (TIGR01451 family)
MQAQAFKFSITNFTKSLNFNLISFWLVLFLLCFNVQLIYAQNQGEGSISLYPAGKQGGRAFLMSKSVDEVFNPFATPGRMFVYVREGDIIYVGSSVQGTDGGTIRLYPPNGRGASPTKYYTSGNSTTVGRIADRSQELIGPKIQVNAALAGYVPYAQTVASGEEGVWTIEFHSRNIATGTTGQTGMNVLADSEWRTAQDDVGTGTAFIAAWNVAVWGDPDGPGSITAKQFIPGRLFTQVFAGSINGANPGFYGDFKVITKDGFVYDVDNNGQNGLSFNFYVNNKGVVNNITTDPTPTYLSLGSSALATIQPKIWDPRDFDDDVNNNITHKMFYGLPDRYMPKISSVWDIANNITKSDYWLKPVRINPVMTDLSFVGAEGTQGQAGSKGGFVVFNSNVNGIYEITIPLSSPYTTRILKGPAVLGLNRVYWDGKDQNGTQVASGISVSSITTQLSGAEVHFPLIDVENNPNGVKIQLLDNDQNLFSPTKDVVYWDNTGLTLGGTNPPVQQFNNNTSGSHSVGSGHKWGTAGVFPSTAGANTNFGDAKTVDTWSYAPGEKQTLTGVVIDIKSSDLEVVSLAKTSAATSIGLSGTTTATYEVVIKNSGPIAATVEKAATFFFYVPLGISINPANVVFTTADGAVLRGSATFTSLSAVNMYKVQVDMPINAQAKFTIPIAMISATPTNKINAWGAIMRNVDVSDPNATNLDYVNIPSPRDPFEEANGIQQLVENLNLNATNIATAFPTLANTSGPNYTNNIKYHQALTSNNVATTTLSIVKTGSRVNATSGSAATFSITVKNTGNTVTATNTVLTDALGVTKYTFTNLPANYYVSQGTISFASNTITWNIGSLAPQATATIVFKTINSTNTDNTGNRTNSASVVANEALLVSSSIELTSNVAATDFRVQKTVSNHVDADKVIFTISLNRVSGSTSNTVTVSDLLPKGYTYVSHSTATGTATLDAVNGLIWSPGAINDATVRTLTITATVNAPTGSQDEYVNTTRILTSSTPDSDLSNNTASAEINADLSVIKTVDQPIPVIATNVVFTLTAKNSATSQHATGVKVSDILPSGYTYVSNLPSTGTFDSSTGIWTIGRLAAAGTATLNITATVKATGSYVNTGVISGGQDDSNLVNNVSTITIVPRNGLLITNPNIYQRIR